jgi:hypothetical protein
MAFAMANQLVDCAMKSDLCVFWTLQVVHSVNEKQQASILRGKKKSKKVLKAALRKEKFSRAIQKCDI